MPLGFLEDNLIKVVVDVSCFSTQEASGVTSPRFAREGEPVGHGWTGRLSERVHGIAGTRV